MSLYVLIYLPVPLIFHVKWAYARHMRLRAFLVVELVYKALDMLEPYSAMRVRLVAPWLQDLLELLGSFVTP